MMGKRIALLESPNPTHKTMACWLGKKGRWGAVVGSLQDAREGLGMIRKGWETPQHSTIVSTL